jgi:hypothetical protein
MKRYIARQILIAKLAALALSALCFLQAPVRAQETTRNVLFQSVGVAPGQRVSLTLFNPNDTPVLAQAQLHDASGAQVALGDGSVRFLSASIPPDAFHSFKIDYSDIRLPCLEKTCRKQIRPSFTLSFSEANNPFVASMEIIEVKDGTSNTVFVGEIPTSQAGGDGNDIIISGFGNDTIMGVPLGHMLLVTLFNPPASGSEAQGEPVSVHVKVFDGNGNQIAQSPELVIPQGEFCSVAFNRNALPILGEPGTNRAQVRIKPFFTFESERRSPVVGSIEIVDASTGRTKVGGAVAAVLYAY